MQAMQTLKHTSYTYTCNFLLLNIKLQNDSIEIL